MKTSYTIAEARNLIVKSRGKYGNCRTKYGDRIYDSAKEARFAAGLDMQMNARGKDRVVSWEPQVPLPIEINGTKVCKYICDFKVVRANGTVEYVDVKGFKTAMYRLKKKLVRAVYGIEIIEA